MFQFVRCATIACLLCCLLLSDVHFAFAQGTKADYDRAANLRQSSRGKVFRDQVRAEWIEGKPQFWYRVEAAPAQYRFIFVDAEKAERRDAFDHDKLAAALSAASGREVQPDRLPFRTLAFTGDLAAVRFSAFDKRWEYKFADNSLRELGAGEDAQSTVTVLAAPRPSRNGGEETRVRFVNQTATDVELFWIDGGGERRSYGKISPGAEHDQHTYAGHVWLAADDDGRPVALFEATAAAGDAIIDGAAQVRPRRRPGQRNRRNRGGGADSPDGKWQAFIQDHNVFIRPADDNNNADDESERDQIQLSTTGSADDPFIGRFAWSPDSTRLVAIQERVGEEREVHIVESSPRDQLQPKLHTFGYAKPGDAMPVARPRLFDVNERRQIDVADDLFQNAWSISDLRWRADSQSFSFLYNQRGHQVLRIVAVDATSGNATAIVDEQSDTFIDYAGKQYSRYLDDTQEIVWMSERDGWNHLYLYDAATGKVKNQITSGAWVVRGVERVDEEQRQIWFRAGGIDPEQDPYYVHYCRVDFDGENLVRLTAGDGTHDVEFSPDNKHLIDRYSRVDLPPVTELRRTSDGSLVCELERGDNTPLVESGWIAPERFVAKARDEQTDIYGVIFRPTTFDPAQKYPVIEQIYAGPHSAHVPKSFAAHHGAQAMAELGFIVVQIDGMGTSQRSKAFHDVCHQNLADAGFEDRILWIKAAAEKHPEMDLSRVGVYGGSAGGQNALGALLWHGDFYHAAVADCGCHDNRMDKIWWNELWMGWPIGPQYEQQSNATNAHKLQGKLLLIVGELDRNVDPASTMQVVDALIKADKDFDFVIIPGAGHGAAGTPYGRRRQRDFFVRNLLGVEPRGEEVGER